MIKQELFKRLVQVDFPDSEYERIITRKNQIDLHHAVSPGHSIQGDIAHFKSQKSKIAVHIFITNDGIAHQLYSSKYFGRHLGIKQSVFDKYGLHTNNLYLDKRSLAIELDGLGPVTKDGGSVAYGPKLRAQSGIQEYPSKYRGYRYFEKYSPKQISTLKLLLLYWGDRYNISLEYNEDMWDVSENALRGRPGVWSHTSYRKDKSDCHPQPELIKMLQSLKPK